MWGRADPSDSGSWSRGIVWARSGTAAVEWRPNPGRGLAWCTVDARNSVRRARTRRHVSSRHSRDQRQHTCLPASCRTTPSPWQPPRYHDDTWRSVSAARRTRHLHHQEFFINSINSSSSSSVYNHWIQVILKKLLKLWNVFIVMWQVIIYDHRYNIPYTGLFLPHNVDGTLNAVLAAKNLFSNIER